MAAVVAMVDSLPLDEQPAAAGLTGPLAAALSRLGRGLMRKECESAGCKRGAAAVSRPPAAPVPAPVRRGEIWWVDLDPTRGGEIRKTRPGAVAPADGLNRARRTVIVVPLSTLSAGPTPRPPIVVSTPPAGAGSVAVCDRAVDRGRLSRRAGRLDDSDREAVSAALRDILCL
jgi:mRNA interferase MazF